MKHELLKSRRYLYGTARGHRQGPVPVWKKKFLEQDILVAETCLYYEVSWCSGVSETSCSLCSWSWTALWAVGTCLCGLTGRQNPLSSPLGLKNGSAEKWRRTAGCFWKLELVALSHGNLQLYPLQVYLMARKDWGPQIGGLWACMPIVRRS